MASRFGRKLKPFAELRPSGQRDIQRVATKYGVSIDEVRATPELAKLARRHAKSESHPERESVTFPAKGANRETVGTLGSKSNEPLLTAIRRDIASQKGRNVMIAVQGQFARYGRQGGKGMSAVVNRDDALEILNDKELTYHEKIAELLGTDPEDVERVEAIYVGETKGS